VTNSWGAPVPGGPSHSLALEKGKRMKEAARERIFRVWISFPAYTELDEA